MNTNRNEFCVQKYCRFTCSTADIYIYNTIYNEGPRIAWGRNYYVAKPWTLPKIILKNIFCRDPVSWIFPGIKKVVKLQLSSVSWLAAPTCSMMTSSSRVSKSNTWMPREVKWKVGSCTHTFRGSSQTFMLSLSREWPITRRWYQRQVLATDCCNGCCLFSAQM